MFQLIKQTETLTADFDYVIYTSLFAKRQQQQIEAKAKQTQITDEQQGYL